MTPIKPRILMALCLASPLLGGDIDIKSYLQRRPVALELECERPGAYAERITLRLQSNAIFYEKRAGGRITAAGRFGDYYWQVEPWMSERTGMQFFSSWTNQGIPAESKNDLLKMEERIEGACAPILNFGIQAGKPWAMAWRGDSFSFTNMVFISSTRPSPFLSTGCLLRNVEGCITGVDITVTQPKGRRIRHVIEYSYEAGNRNISPGLPSGYRLWTSFKTPEPRTFFSQHTRILTFKLSDTNFPREHFMPREGLVMNNAVPWWLSNGVEYVKLPRGEVQRFNDPEMQRRALRHPPEHLSEIYLALAGVVLLASAGLAVKLLLGNANH